MNRFKTIVEIESQKEYYQKLHQIIEKEYEKIIGYKPEFYVVDISDGTRRIE